MIISMLVDEQDDRWDDVDNPSFMLMVIMFALNDDEDVNEDKMAKMMSKSIQAFELSKSQIIWTLETPTTLT